MLRLFLLLLFLGPLSIVFQACNPCDCPPTKTRHVKLLKVDLDAMQQDLHGQWADVVDSSMVDREDFHLFFERFAMIAKNEFKKNKTFSNPFIASALACSCADDEIINNQKFISLQIISENDFNGNYSAGDTINNIIKINGIMFNDWFFDHKQNFDKNFNTVENMELTFTQEPTLEVWQQIRLVYSIQDGTGTEIYDVITPVFWLF